MAVFTSVSLDDVRPWIAQFPLGEAVALKGIASGIENSNFFLTTQDGDVRTEHVLTIFENLGFEQLPFYLQLMRHLAGHGVLVPEPVPNHDGQLCVPLHGKPAAIVSKLEGSSQMDPQPVHCAAVGDMLARMHLAGRDFSLHQPNLRGIAWWHETAPAVLPHLSEAEAQLLRSEIHFQEAFHGSDLDKGVLDTARARAMLDAYHAVRPFTADEQAGWQCALRAGALRFWLSRLYDLYQPRAAEMLTPHDPTHFERILRERIATPAPRLFA